MTNQEKKIYMLAELILGFYEIVSDDYFHNVNKDEIDKAINKFKIELNKVVQKHEIKKQTKEKISN